MSRTVAINGIGLHEVQMPLEPYGNGTVSYLSYPASQIQVSRRGHGLCLVVPAYLAVELYRTGVLPQDDGAPVEVSIDGGSAAWYLVNDVRYPSSNDGPFGNVTFTLTRVRQGNVGDAGDATARSHSDVPGTGTYVTDIMHYLDESGDMAPMPGPARKLASFLTLLIDAATGAASPQFQDTGIRCRTKSCTGTILTVLPPGQNEINWHCPACGHHGVIRNWQDTKWNRLKHSEQSE